MDDDRFWVKSLTLENFRCFERLELRDLDPHFNLLVGANGTGKSSVLLALVRLFRDLAALWWPISPDSILSGPDRRNSRQKLAGSLKVEAKQPWVLSSEFAWHTQTYNVSETFYPEPFSSGTHYEVLEDSRKTQTVTSTSWSQKLHAGPQLIAFYRVRRQFSRLIGNSDAPAFFENPEYAGLQNWDDAGVSSVALHEWLKDQTLLALQSEDRIRRGIGKPGETPARRQLTLVQGALANALEDASHIEVDGDLNDIVVEFKNAPRQQFAQMSDGQRTLVGMVADVVRRACLLNFERYGAETLQRTTGLVIIDEIDLHLHPKWQRRIVGALKTIFPKIQFFATTHSPQVIGEAKPREVILLTEDGRQKRPIQSFGMDTNWILECVMEAQGRNPEVAKDVKRLYDAIDDGKFEEARELMAKLREEVGNFGDVEAAESYIWRVEHEADEAAE